MPDYYGSMDLSSSLNLFRSMLGRAIEGKGAILCVEGEEGFGKSHILSAYETEATNKKWNALPVLIEAQSPIGNFQISNIQPLLPFSKIIEKLLTNKALSANKKFAINAGITALSAIPLVGDVFYLVKEISKDWRQFKKDKSKESKIKVSMASSNYFDAISSYCDKTPLTLLMDDMHWCDAQSVELLGLLLENIQTMPLLLVISYSRSILNRGASPLLYFLQKCEGRSDVNRIELQPFTSSQINEFCKFYIPAYSPNEEFENWVLGRSYGVPSIVIEYLKFFQINSPFNTEGKLDESFKTNDYLPISAQAAFSQTIEKLGEEERNIIAVCSSEGREFTALIVSELLHTDVLSTIKKLRFLQHKTGIIKSIGASSRYGVNTTVYQFTQAFYHTYFENSLEYEEHVALHGQIAGLLKKKYEESDSESVREQIAPFLAAHSAESGDMELAKSMLLVSAQAASKYGSGDAVRQAYDSFVNIGAPIEESDENYSEALAFQEIMQRFPNGESPGGPVQGTSADNSAGAGEEPELKLHHDFLTIRKAIIRDIGSEKFSTAAELAAVYLNGHEDMLAPDEKAQLLILSAKIQIEEKDYDGAENNCRGAADILKANPDGISECMLLNVWALLKNLLNRKAEAITYLQESSKKSMSLPAEFRLMTLANIAETLRDYSPAESSSYLNAARKLAAQLNYEGVV